MPGQLNKEIRITADATSFYETLQQLAQKVQETGGDINKLLSPELSSAQRALFTQTAQQAPQGAFAASLDSTFSGAEQSSRNSAMMAMLHGNMEGKGGKEGEGSPVGGAEERKKIADMFLGVTKEQVRLLKEQANDERGRDKELATQQLSLFKQLQKGDKLDDNQLAEAVKGGMHQDRLVQDGKKDSQIGDYSSIPQLTQMAASDVRSGQPLSGAVAGSTLGRLMKFLSGMGPIGGTLAGAVALISSTALLTHMRESAEMPTEQVMGGEVSSDDFSLPSAFGTGAGYEKMIQRAGELTQNIGFSLGGDRKRTIEQMAQVFVKAKASPIQEGDLVQAMNLQEFQATQTDVSSLLSGIASVTSTEGTYDRLKQADYVKLYNALGGMMMQQNQLPDSGTLTGLVGLGAAVGGSFGDERAASRFSSIHGAMSQGNEFQQAYFAQTAQAMSDTHLTNFELLKLKDEGLSAKIGGELVFTQTLDNLTKGKVGQRQFYEAMGAFNLNATQSEQLLLGWQGVSEERKEQLRRVTDGEQLKDVLIDTKAGEDLQLGTTGFEATSAAITGELKSLLTGLSGDLDLGDIKEAGEKISDFIKRFKENPIAAMGEGMLDLGKGAFNIQQGMADALKDAVSRALEEWWKYAGWDITVKESFDRLPDAIANALSSTGSAISEASFTKWLQMKMKEWGYSFSSGDPPPPPPNDES